MGNIAKIGNLAPVFELAEDDDEPTVSFIVPDSKSLWRSAHEYRKIGPPSPAETSGARAEGYLRFFYRSSKWKMSISGRGLKLEPDASYRVEDADAAVDFFEHSDSSTFGIFCGLLQQKLRYEHVWKRVVLVASCLPELTGMINVAPLHRGAEYRLSGGKPLLLTPPTKSTSPADEELSRAIDSQRFDTAKKLIANGEVDRGLDILYGTVDDILYSGDYSTLDSAFENIDASTAPLDFLLGMLTASLPVKTRLPSRAAFFSKVKDVITARDDYEDGLLTGLE